MRFKKNGIRTGVMQVAALAMVCCVALPGCGGPASYVTPGAGVDLAALSDASVTEGIADAFRRKPLSPFPATMAVVRVQAPRYYSRTSESYGTGKYSVVTTRDIEEDADFEHLTTLPSVRGVVALNQIVIPSRLETDEQLRQAAAQVHADMLLIYTINTKFRVKDHDVGPLGPLTLGFLPNQEAKVVSTASAAVYDVRTGFVYGLAEATAEANQRANVWRTETAVDESRKEAERAAFSKLLTEFDTTWQGIVGQHATPS